MTLPKSILTLIVALLQICGISNPFGVVQKPTDPTDGGDPVIVEDNGSAYYLFTTGGGVDIRRIAAFDNATTIEQKTVYWAGSDGIEGEIWAPEIHKIGKKWYIVACAKFREDAVPKGTMPERNSDEPHSDYYRYGFVLESKTEDIFGEYEFKSRLAPDGLNNIDGTYLQRDGRLYYVCSAYVDVAHQCICIAEMENPYTFRSDADGKNNAVMISRPQLPWEKVGWWVNEGPAVLYVGDNVHIVYSGSGYSSGKYCLGMLTLAGDDVMKKSSWIKSPLPVMKGGKTSGVYHTGHCSFLYRDNGEVYMVYHATDDPDFFAKRRCTYIKKIEFIGNYPIFNM